MTRRQPSERESDRFVVALRRRPRLAGDNRVGSQQRYSLYAQKARGRHEMAHIYAARGEASRRLLLSIASKDVRFR